jgi:shikimate dehydrogenase
MRGDTRFTGLLGWPLEYTLSPTIHNAGFRSIDLDWVYLRWPVPPERLEGAVAGLRALGAEGANVTIPHKETVIPYLDELSGDARRVGAVNTIHRLGDTLIGHNTDVDGFRETVLADAGIDVAEKTALVLGAGGGARAVVCALSDLGVSQITIAARSEERVKGLLPLARAAQVTSWDQAVEVATNTDIVVNATPLGGRGERALEGSTWHEGQSLFDLVYRPAVTPLMEDARAGGADAWGGLGMLIQQAAASFRIWTGKDPAPGAMSAAAVRALGSA